MAKKNQLDFARKERITRTFSESFKRQKVKEIITGKSSISEVHKLYSVSFTSIYRWIRKYGVNHESGVKMVIETESDTRELLKLKKTIAELEQLVGQKQVFIEFQQKMIELAEVEYGVDIKKKFSSRPSSTSGKIEKKMLFH